MISVRKAESPQDRWKVFRLRYEIYVEEMQRPQGDADHEKRIIEDALDEKGHLFLAEDDGHLVGTIRINFRREAPLECEELYELDRFEKDFPGQISMTTRLMVRQSHRGTMVAAKLAMAVYQFGHEGGIQFDFIDCNPHLVRLYQQLGHRIYRPTIQHPDYGTVIPMVMALEDVEHFDEVRSPFRRIQRRYPNSTRSREFFQSEYGAYAEVRPAFLMSGNELLEEWSQELVDRGGDPQDTLLAEVSGEERCFALNHFDALRYEKGDFIVREGEESQGLFLILKGSAVVLCRDSQGKEHMVEVLVPGETFGEMGLISDRRRIATIRAEEEVQVLLLTRQEFLKMRQAHPAIVLRIIENLFGQVVDRFERIQAAWLKSQVLDEDSMEREAEEIGVA